MTETGNKDHFSSKSSTPEPFSCCWRIPSNPCSKVFPNAELLFKHVYQHINDAKSDGQSFSCHWGDCDKVKSRKDHLVSHIRVHVPHRPYKCRICGKAFKRSNDTREHELIHQKPQEKKVNRWRRRVPMRHSRFNYSMDESMFPRGTEFGFLANQPHPSQHMRSSSIDNPEFINNTKAEGNVLDAYRRLEVLSDQANMEYLLQGSQTIIQPSLQQQQQQSQSHPHMFNGNFSSYNESNKFSQIEQSTIESDSMNFGISNSASAHSGLEMRRMGDSTILNPIGNVPSDTQANQQHYSQNLRFFNNSPPSRSPPSIPSNLQVQYPTTYQENTSSQYLNTQQSLFFSQKSPVSPKKGAFIEGSCH